MKHDEKLMLDHVVIQLPMIDYHKGRPAPKSSGAKYVALTQKVIDGEISYSDWSASVPVRP